MKKTLERFITKGEESLVAPSNAFLKKMGLVSSPYLRRGELKDSLFLTKDFTYNYVKNAKDYVEGIWDIGLIEDSFIPKPDNIEKERYEGIYVFACRIKTDVMFNRTTAVSLTRAFNKTLLSSVTDYPTIVLYLQGDLLSIATCERTERRDDKGEKIGKVTMLRNINCRNLHPGHRQILEKIAKDVSCSGTYASLHTKWLKSFSVDVISDDFFNNYKLVYEDIVEYATGKRMIKKDGKWIERNNHHPSADIMKEFAHFSDPDKAVRDYVKDLMGRIVFIHFLQKKGWMGVPEGDGWTGGDPEFIENLFTHSNKKATFIDDVLNPLFRDLNTNRSKNGDIVSFPELEGGRVKVPYLNGGLFEDKHIKFPLDESHIKQMFDFFSNYNFTIDENAPDDMETGVDPEMLGRIFENLLEDNKDKGAFYTPKDVVKYMCREAIVEYLQEDVVDEEFKESIRSFVCSHNINDLKSSLVYPIDTKLRNIKICDPAIGSGAFPMGMLRELYECRYAIRGKEGETPSQIKKDIIQNSIYGVDIERGAVDIARLRFWLSLIIDEDTPHTLPNMDFKIMQGNSLLEEHEGVNLSGLSIDEQKAKKSKKGDAFQLTIPMDEQSALDNIQKAIHQYYNTDNHIIKEERRKDINTNIIDYILRLKNYTPSIQNQLKSLNIPNDKFFLWHIYFKEVFDNGGFDIVIGNPPYGVSIKGTYRKSVIESLGVVPDYEIYYYFIELSKTLLRNNGILSYIIPNTWLFNQFAKEYRTAILKRWEISEILDCSNFRIFESADVRNTIIRFIIKDKPNNLIGYKNTFNANSFDDLISKPSEKIHANEILAMNQNWGLIFRLNKKTISLVQKIRNNRQTLESLFPDISQGLIAYDKYTGQDPEIIKTRAFHYSKYHKGLKKMLWGEDVTRYSIVWNGKEWIDYCDRIANPRQPKFFVGKRLLVREITNPSIYATITNEEFYHDPSIIVVLNNSACVFSIETLLGIFNSKLATYFHFNFSPKATKGSFPKILVQDVKDFPLPFMNKDADQIISSLVVKVLQSKDKDINADTSASEHSIDRKVYELYGLTNSEVRMIDPLEDISGEDDALFKA